MPVYQNSSVDSDKLILGNCKIETSATAGGTYVNLGAGIVNSFTHSPEFYDVQAGNAPDPIEGVATEIATIEFELIEYDGSVLSAIQCGLTEYSATSALSTFTSGGNQTLTPRAFRLTNTRTIGTTTVETILTVYRATMKTGMTINFKSDNDTDPIAVLPGTIEAKIDSTRTEGDQLFSITRTVV
jgi:hypothetical protein